MSFGPNNILNEQIEGVMKRILFIIIMVFATLLNAQTVGGSIMIGSPQGEFRNNVDRLGYGLQIQGTLWSPGKARPFTIGLSASYMVYGETNERRPWPGFPEVTLNVSRTNSLANLHLLMQVSPFNGTVRPYLDGLVGGSYIFTTSEVKSENSSEPIAQSTNFDDFNWSYGWGGGLLIRVAKELGDVSNLYLDLKARYLYGTEAQYLTENDIDIVSLTQVKYRPRKSKTDILTFHIGVIAYF